MGIVGTARWHLHSLPVVAMMAATSQQRRRPVAAPMRDQTEIRRDQRSAVASKSTKKMCRYLFQRYGIVVQLRYSRAAAIRFQ